MAVDSGAEEHGVVQVIGLPPRYYLHHYVSSDEIEIGTLKLSGGEARELDLDGRG